MNKSNKTFHSFSLPLWQLVLFHTITLSLYDFYWFYRNWKQVYEHNHLEKRALLLTLGMLIPGLNIFLLWELLADIKTFAEKEGVPSFNHPAWLSVLYCVLCNAIGFLPDSMAVYLFLALPLTVFPLVIVQKTLNRYWDKVQPERVRKTGLSWKEVVFGCLCTPLYLLALAGVAATALGWIPA